MPKATQRRDQPESELERFYSIIIASPQSDRRLKIKDICDLLDDADFWSEEFFDKAADAQKHSRARQLIRLLKDEADNFPLFASIRSVDEDGKIERLYKPVNKFTKEDYHQQAADWSDRSNYDLKMCVGLNRRYFKKYSEQLEFQFEFDIRLPKAK